MNREDIIRMARRYGYVIVEDGPDSQCEVSFSADQLLALLQFVAAAEREACAQVVESLDGCAQYFPHVPDAIRARGNA